MNLKPKIILLVEDNQSDVELTRRALDKSHIYNELAVVEDGQEALEVISENRPDVILLDLMMPIMNGLQFLEKRASTPHLGEIPIILTSAGDISGQPAVSIAIAVTKRSGLSMQEVLSVIEMVSRKLSIGWPKDDRVLQEEPAG